MFWLFTGGFYGMGEPVHSASLPLIFQKYPLLYYG